MRNICLTEDHIPAKQKKKILVYALSLYLKQPQNTEHVCLNRHQQYKPTTISHVYGIVSVALTLGSCSQYKSNVSKALQDETSGPPSPVSCFTYWPIRCLWGPNEQGMEAEAHPYCCLPAQYPEVSCLRLWRLLAATMASSQWTSPAWICLILFFNYLCSWTLQFNFSLSKEVFPFVWLKPTSQQLK